MWSAQGGISKNGNYAVIGLYDDKKVYYTHDGGNNWNESTINLYTSMHRLRGVYLSKNGRYSTCGDAIVSPHIYYSSDYGVTYNYINRTGSSYFFETTFVNEDGTISIVTTIEQPGYTSSFFVGYIDKSNLTNTSWTAITGVGSFGNILSNDNGKRYFFQKII